MFDECLIWRNWLLCLREQRVLCMIYIDLVGCLWCYVPFYNKWWFFCISFSFEGIPILVLVTVLLQILDPWNNHFCKIVLRVSGFFLVILYYFDCVGPMLPRHILVGLEGSMLVLVVVGLQVGWRIFTLRLCRVSRLEKSCISYLHYQCLYLWIQNDHFQVVSCSPYQ